MSKAEPARNRHAVSGPPPGGSLCAIEAHQAPARDRKAPQRPSNGTSPPWLTSGGSAHVLQRHRFSTVTPGSPNREAICSNCARALSQRKEEGPRDERDQHRHHAVRSCHSYRHAKRLRFERADRVGSASWGPTVEDGARRSRLAQGYYSDAYLSGMICSSASVKAKLKSTPEKP